MNWSDFHLNRSPVWAAAAIFLFLIVAVYFNTFDAAWQFDDKPNILDNRNIHIRNLKPESLIQTFYSRPTAPGKIGEKPYRPLSFFTFAVNWYIGGDKVRGYHIVNTLIHFWTTFFLFMASLNLLGAPNLKEKFERSKYFIAFLSAALWAINPIQTQAVTYIVQRMASLAAMFYILSILCYVKCRLSSSSVQRVLLALGCVLTFLLALGSKENAATLPAALFLIEMACFQNFNWRHTKSLYIGAAVAGGMFILLLGLWLHHSNITLSFLSGYGHRPFSLTERLLTEPRIILFYLSQIFFPWPSRLSVEHDVVLSTSLFDPWTTLPAILLTLVLIGLGFCWLRKRPLIALALLFFFLNHIIESTILPLELIFEHRNYLPSMFLFLPIAAGFKWLHGYLGAQDRPQLAGVLTGLMVLSIVGLGIGTYVRNLAWATETSLWRDAMNKAPKSARPLTNLAWQMAYGPDAREGLYDEALRLYERALALQTSRLSADPVIMHNMAGIYFKQDKSSKAIELLEAALDLDPDYNWGRYDLARILMVDEKWNQAAKHVEYLLAKDDRHEKYLCLKGQLFLHQKKYDAAIHYLRRSMTSYPFFKETLMNLGIAYSLTGDYRSAEVYLIRAHQVHPKNMIPLMGLIENKLRAADFKGAQKYAAIINSTYNRAAIKRQLQNLSRDHLSLFLSAESISPVIENQYANNSKDLTEISN